jgi:hypothetical protein
MRGHRSAVDPTQGGEDPQHAERGDGDEHAQHDGGDEWQGNLGRRRLTQRDTALDADGKEEVHRCCLIHRVGESEVRLDSDGDETQDECEDRRGREIQ